MLHQTATIGVRARADAAFDVVATDLLSVNDSSDAMAGHRPLDDGPLREGFRWQQTLVHERQLCVTEWRITELQLPDRLEQTMVHFCAVARRDLRGGERWEFVAQDDGSTLVTLRYWHSTAGCAGWLQKILGRGLGQAVELSLKRRLAHVQFQAERNARQQPEFKA